jgi:glycosyltransferase involved in cell wall biosynthesis
MSDKISALLISFNEEKNIERFLKEASYYADEIIIVDSFSDDNTEILAKKNPKVKFIKKEFNNFTEQRNFALSIANNDWITFFDADESISQALLDEIIETIKKPTFDAYYVYRKFYFKNKHIKHTGMNHDKAVRLFRKSKVQYDENLLVHETVNYDGSIGTLKNKLNHYTFNNEQEYLDKLNHYSRLRAEELYIKKLKPNFFHYVIKPAFKFFKFYFINLGFLDGKEGFVISKIHATSIFNRYKYLDEIYRKEKR